MTQLLFERVTIKMLRYFYEVAQTGHFTQAAKNLSITNSPLSNQIMELESLLGTKLFERDSRNVSLTKTGELLKLKCNVIFQTIELSLNQVQQLGCSNKNMLRVGMVSSAFWGGFDLILNSFHNTYPDHKADIFDLNPEIQKKYLNEKKIEIGIVRFADTLNISPYSYKSITKENFIVAVSKNHDLKDRNVVSLKELSAYSFTFMSKKNSASADFIINACLQEGFIPNVVKEVVEPTTLMAYVANSDTITLVPNTFTKHKWNGIKFLKLKEKLRADLCLIYDEKHDCDIVGKFIDGIKKGI
ncbi:LysR family transcriptional regulator [Psychromonas hadalis]|uniref:LysR family transcriptional regulator n=1 Tax=Psychromonas hadalis TaxID=211669 RepID=UPI0003B5FC77|nr:LysR family transcriptional regulator [Psychromonas hadalis]